MVSEKLGVSAALGAEYYRRVEIVSIGPGFAMSFKRTAPAVQRCKNEQERCSYGRETGRRPQVRVVAGVRVALGDAAVHAAQIAAARVLRAVAAPRVRRAVPTSRTRGRAEISRL